MCGMNIFLFWSAIVLAIFRDARCDSSTTPEPFTEWRYKCSGLPPKCPPGYTRYHGELRCFQFHSDLLNFAEATQACQAAGGGSLAKIETTGLLDWTKSKMIPEEFAEDDWWLGLYESETDKNAYVWTCDNTTYSRNGAMWAKRGTSGKFQNGIKCFNLNWNKKDYYELDSADCGKAARFMCEAPVVAVDPCRDLTNWCLNGAECLSTMDPPDLTCGDAEMSFHCECVDDYYGYHCETAPPDCCCTAIAQSSASAVSFAAAAAEAQANASAQAIASAKAQAYASAKSLAFAQAFSLSTETIKEEASAMSLAFTKVSELAYGMAEAMKEAAESSKRRAEAAAGALSASQALSAATSKSLASADAYVHTIRTVSSWAKAFAVAAVNATAESKAEASSCAAKSGRRRK